MTNARISMEKAREILRLSWQQRISQEKTRIACRVSKSTVWKTLNRARTAGLHTWNDIEQLTEEQLLEKLFPVQEVESGHPLPDWNLIHSRLRTEKHCTRQHLWEEYRLANSGTGLGFSQFCDLYRSWSKGLNFVMRQEHHPGEKLFVDYAGDTLTYWDRASGEERKAHLFVAVLGYSNYTFARATADESRNSWLSCHVAAFSFFGGVPDLVVPDNAKPLVDKACIYDPDVNRAYTDLARHYGTAVLPARPRKPRDKAKVEAAVLLVERWILARLRKLHFTSLEEINEAVARLLRELNSKSFRKIGGSRQSMFEEKECALLQPLPEQEFEIADWKKARVNIDYHIEFDGHYYSVPFRHAREKVDLRFTNKSVEIYLSGARIAAHARSYARGRHTTVLEHMPKSHREQAEWTPERILRWAGKIGPETRDLIANLIESRDHPAQGFRAALGILRLSNNYGEPALENASRKANSVRCYRYAYLRDLLRGKRPFLKPECKQEPTSGGKWHSNIRGPEAFRTKTDDESEALFQEATIKNKEDIC